MLLVVVYVLAVKGGGVCVCVCVQCLFQAYRIDVD